MNAPPGTPPCPVSLDELLRAVDRAGRFQHLSISRLPGRRYQVSFKPERGAGYRVVIENDLLAAVQGALGPAYGHDWPDLLGGASGAETINDNSDLL